MTTLKVKSGAGGTWEEVGGIGLGVPAGGTTGQILTKTSAADYATAWSSTPPILANNTDLQAYRADGTTPQNLIGVRTDDHVMIALGLNTASKVILIPAGAQLSALRSDSSIQHLISNNAASGDTSVLYGSPGNLQIGQATQGDISIGLGLAAGKNIYVPRLTVQGPLTLQDQQHVLSTTGEIALIPSSVAGRVYFAHNTSADFNLTAGATYFRRAVQMDADLTVFGTLYKGGAGAYTFPDFVFEHHFTGGIERFRDAPGAETYEGLWPLARVEEFAQEHWRLPGHAARENDRVDIFRRTHDLLAELERVYLHLFEHERRLTELEER